MSEDLQSLTEPFKQRGVLDDGIGSTRFTCRFSFTIT